MKWLDNLKQKLRIISKEEAEEIPLDELENHIKSRTEDVISEEKKKVQELVDSVIEAVDYLQQSLSELEKADPDQRHYPSSVISMSKSLRDSFCKASKRYIKEIQKPEVTYTRIEQFKKSITEVLSNLDFTPKQAELIPMFFGKKVEQIYKDIQGLKKAFVQLNQATDQDCILSLGEKIFQNIEDALDTKVDIIGLSKKIQGMESEIKEAIESKRLIDENIQHIDLNSPLDDEINQTESKISFLVQKINQQFEPLSKPLKKFKHYPDKYNVNLSLLDKYIDSFFVGLIFDEKMHIRDIVAYLLKEDLGLESRVIEKVAALRQTLLSFDRISIENEYTSLLNNLNKKKDERDSLLKPQVTKKRELEKKQELYSKQIAELNQEIEDKTKLLTKQQNIFSALIADLQKEIRDLISKEIVIK